MHTWLPALFGSAIGGAFAFFLAIRCMERAGLPLIRNMLRERDAAIWNALQHQAHELETLRKTQSLESEWYTLARQLAEHDGKEASS